MHLLITLVCAVVGAWFFLGGLASFVVPGDAVPSLGTSTVIGGVLLVVAYLLWSRRRRTADAAMSFVLLPRNGEPPVEAIERAWSELAAGQPPLRIEGSGSAALRIESEGLVTMVGSMPMPIPNGEAERAARHGLPALSSGEVPPLAHAAHWIVFSQGRGLPVAERLLRHNRVIAALVRAAGAVGVYDGAAGAAFDADSYLRVLRDALRQEDWPVPLWTGVRVEQKGERLEYLTLGMKQLQLPELLVVAPGKLADDALNFLFVVVEYVARRGREIPAGETVGRSATEKYVVDHVPSPCDAATRVMRIDMARPV
jgi:hypothetical protein